MDEEAVREILRTANALATDGHFVLSSGQHSDIYVNKDILFCRPRVISRLGREIARRFAGDQSEVVCGPGAAGAILASRVAEWLTELTGREVLAVYADKLGQIGQSFILRRGYDRAVFGRRVLLVEDILTTGLSSHKLADVVRVSGGKVVGLGALVNRGGVTACAAGNVPKLISLVSLNLKSWSERACARNGPCARGVPVNTELGHGREFLAKQKRKN